MSAGRYEIRLKGRLGARRAVRFDGMTLTTRADGTTVIEGPVVDQAALHGLLRTLRDLGLPRELSLGIYLMVKGFKSSGIERLQADRRAVPTPHAVPTPSRVVADPGG